MKNKLIFILLFAALGVGAQFAQPFEWKALYSDKTESLNVSVSVPDGHYLYLVQKGRLILDLGLRGLKKNSWISRPREKATGSSRISQRYGKKPINISRYPVS